MSQQRIDFPQHQRPESRGTGSPYTLVSSSMLIDECFSRLVLQCASSRLLTEFTVLAAITDSWREFESLTILCKNANFHQFRWNFSILSFAKRLRVDLF